MKPQSIHFHACLATVVLTLSWGAVAGAQTAAVRTPEVVPVDKVEGTLRSVEPSTLAVQKEGKEKPLTYRRAQTIRYVDDTGKEVKRELLVPGLPVTVQYRREGDELVADEVIVHQKAVMHPDGTTTTTSTSTTTTTADTVKKPTVAEGVLGLWETDRFELNTPKSGPISFRYSKDTQLVDSDNKHVDVTRMKPGVPVTVSFRQEGDRLMANKVTMNARVVELGHEQ